MPRGSRHYFAPASAPHAPGTYRSHLSLGSGAEEGWYRIRQPSTPTGRTPLAKLPGPARALPRSPSQGARCRSGILRWPCGAPDHRGRSAGQLDTRRGPRDAAREREKGMRLEKRYLRGKSRRRGQWRCCGVTVPAWPGRSRSGALLVLAAVVLAATCAWASLTFLLGGTPPTLRRLIRVRGRRGAHLPMPAPGMPGLRSSSASACPQDCPPAHPPVPAPSKNPWQDGFP